MRNLITGIVIGLMFSTGVAYGYRIAKPVPIREINESTLVELNRGLNGLWDITNGRYNVDVVTTAPTVGSEGDIKGYYSGSTYRLYVYLNGAWRYFNSDG